MHARRQSAVGLRLGLLAVVALLIGCERPDPEAIRFGLAAGPVTLDPRFATDADSSRINRLLYARLVDFDEALRPVPGMARWTEESETRYRFRLLAGRAPFADGRLPDAADVKATYDAVLDPDRGSPHRGGLAQVREVVVVDAQTVDFVLAGPDPLLPAKLVIGVLPRERVATGHPFNTDPSGSGPFELAAWPSEGHLALKRRRDGQRVDFLRIPDPTTRVLKLLNREVDLLQGDLSPEILAWLSHRPGVEVVRRRGTKFAYLGFNLRDPVTSDLRVRRAIAHAVDREAIVRYLLGGGARPAAALLAPDHWAGHPGLSPPAYDPSLARKLLAAAGYGPGNSLRIAYKTSANPLRLRIATVIQHQLAEVGIEVDVRSHDWGTFYGDIKAGRFQMFSLLWVGIKTPDIFRYVFHSESVPPAGANRGRYSSAAVDRLIETAEAAGSWAEQARHYRALQERLLAELPYVPLWYEDNYHVARAQISGYELGADGNYDGLTTVSRR